MFQTDLSHYEIVRHSLAGERAIDEQTYASIAILQEKTERLRKSSKVFAGIAFSTAVQRLATQKSKAAVG